MARSGSSSKQSGPPFAVGDCALITLATGIRGQNLSEFREGLLQVPDSSIEHHFWGRLLSPRFDEPEYSNDFASWAYHALGERALAERLSAVDPTEHDAMEEIRQRLVDIVETTLDARDYVPWARADQRFHFLRGRLVVFRTGSQIAHPSDLAAALAHMSTSSIYYHFIDARRRTPTRCDDFCVWLEGWGPDYAHLKERLHSLDPFFSSLKEIRRMLIETCADHGGAPTSPTPEAAAPDPAPGGRP